MDDIPPPSLMYTYLPPKKDKFFKKLYKYHQNSGFICILVSQIFYILTISFSISITFFMTSCVDWDKLNDQEKNLFSAVYPNCIPDGGHSWLKIILILLLLVGLVSTFVTSGKQLYSMYKVHNFFRDSLGIHKLTTWEDVIFKCNERLNTGCNIDAEYVANRIMRYDNYLISMVTKDIFGLDSLPSVITFTKILEWNLHTCIKATLLKQDGVLMEEVLHRDYSKREHFTKTLENNFKILGILNIVFTPFIVTGLLVYFCYKYVSEYHRNPKALKMYSFTPLAKWKLRDFNELEHIYTKRINFAQPKISEYLEKFRSNVLDTFVQFLSFIVGTILFFLLLVSFGSPETLIFDQPLIYHIGILTALYMQIETSGNNSVVEDIDSFDETFNELVDVLHYTPKSWNNLSNDERYYEIKRLFKYKWVNFMNEILCVFYVPIILLFWLPKKSSNIVNFFRENSVHVDKLEIICSNALFNFDVDGFRDDEDSIQRKMSQSVKNFKNAYKFTDHNSDSESDTGTIRPTRQSVEPSGSEMEFDSLLSKITTHRLP